MGSVPRTVNDQKNLEDFENEAFQKAKLKKKTKTVAMKKPASAKAGMKRPATANTAPAKKAKSAVYGCIRCRGNTKGCSTCQNPLFSGQRFSGRHEWVDWAQKKWQKVAMCPWHCEMPSGVLHAMTCVCTCWGLVNFPSDKHWDCSVVC